MALRQRSFTSISRATCAGIMAVMLGGCEGWMDVPEQDADADNIPDRYDCEATDATRSEDCDADGLSIKQGDCNDLDARIGGATPVPCVPEAGTGPCAKGFWVCGGEDGATAECKANDPIEEACNALDDDCNGIVDDGVPGLNLPCDTANMGACKPGRTTCVGGEIECEALSTPQDELCDAAGEDEDCDGQANDGCACVEGDEQDCYTGPAGTEGVGVCRPGKAYCTILGTWGPCQGERTPGPDVCNGTEATGTPTEDEDCDGVPNQGCQCIPGDVVGCYSGPSGTEGVGICHGGTYVCTSSGQPGPCLGEQVPQAELCNGQPMSGPPQEDEDCDGAANEGCQCIAGDIYSCYDGPIVTENVGICHGGTYVCTSSGQPGPCQGQQTPQAEVCNGLPMGPATQDEDCDGVANEGCQCVAGNIYSCYTGPAGTANIGICHGGTYVCTSSGAPGPCTGEQKPTQEVCDGAYIDEDCDGLADWPNDPDCSCTDGTSMPCNTGVPGECSLGTSVCAGGQWQSCVGNSLSQPEGTACNGKDDDCDGYIDDIATTSGARGVWFSRFTKSCSGPVSDFSFAATHSDPACQLITIPFITSYAGGGSGFSFGISVTAGVPSPLDYAVNVQCGNGFGPISGRVVTISAAGDPQLFVNDSEPFAATDVQECVVINKSYPQASQSYQRLDAAIVTTISGGWSQSAQWSVPWSQTSARPSTRGASGSTKSIAGSVVRLGFGSAPGYPGYVINCSSACIPTQAAPYIVMVPKPVGRYGVPIFSVEYFGGGGTCPDLTSQTCADAGSSGHSFEVTFDPDPITPAEQTANWNATDIEFSIMHTGAVDDRLLYRACVISQAL